jgi:hypothetical protein
MKTIPRILADLALVLISGLIFPRNRDYSEDWDDSRGHPQKKVVKESVEAIIPVVQKNLKYHPPAT